MAAISKAWVTIADSAVDPDSPVDATLMTGLRDNDIHLREWLGASFFAGAVQDHNHDGANSALVPIGPNLIRNGSFEESGTGWTITDYTGGSHAFATAVDHHGAKSLSFTSTVLANGGGDAVSNEYVPVSGGATYRVDFYMSASVGSVSARAQVIWYDDAQAQISAVNIADSTSVPTTKTHYSSPMVAPTTARFARLKLIGGVPAAGAAVGTIYFDGVIMVEPTTAMSKLLSGSVSSQATLDFDLRPYAWYKSFEIRLTDFIPATSSASLYGRVSSNGGSSYDSGATNYAYHAINGSESTSTSNQAGTDTNIVIADSTSTTGGNCARVELLGCTNSAQYPRVFTRATTRDASPNMVGKINTAVRKAQQITNAFRILYSSGNISSGTWELYGYN